MEASIPVARGLGAWDNELPKYSVSLNSQQMLDWQTERSLLIMDCIPSLSLKSILLGLVELWSLPWLLKICDWPSPLSDDGRQRQHLMLLGWNIKADEAHTTMTTLYLQLSLCAHLPFTSSSHLPDYFWNTLNTQVLIICTFPLEPWVSSYWARPP